MRTLLISLLLISPIYAQIVVSPEPKLSLPADSQPTPWPAVYGMLDFLDPKPGEVLLDPGCGYDARFLISAVRDFRVEKAIGVEIDPALAESARRYVADAGLSNRIEIITGDSTKLDVKADIGVAYMWPEFLASFRPKMEKLKRFASYEFSIRGATTKTLSNGGWAYLWKKPFTPKPVSTPAVPITKTMRQTVSLPLGSYCEVCGRNCRNPMAHMSVQTVVGYQQPASGRWVNQRVCVNGQCFTQRVWQSDETSVSSARPNTSIPTPSSPEIVVAATPTYTYSSVQTYSGPVFARPVRSFFAARPVRSLLRRLFGR